MEFTRTGAAIPCDTSVDDFSVGVIADSQYADRDAWCGRQYRMSLQKLNEAIADFDNSNLAFAVHLGDFIDKARENFDAPLRIWRSLKIPTYCVLGNHDFSVEQEWRASIPGILGLRERYYSFQYRGWSFIVLDGNDLSTYAWPKGSENLNQGITLHQTRYTDAPKWNGGISDQQLAWLDTQLTRADQENLPVALICHFPVYPPNEHNLWNAEQVICFLDKHRCVRLWLNGHNHDGNYAERCGVHYLTLKGMVDTPHNSYATLVFSNDKIVVYGRGRQNGFVLSLLR